MTLDFDPNDDLSTVVNGWQPVVLTARDGTTLNVARALRRAVQTAEAAASGGDVLQSDAVWHLSAALVSARPELGATITDAGGEVWTILNVELATLGARWRCRTRNLVIAHRLDMRIAIEQCQFAKGPHGAAIPDWTLWRANLAARLQPLKLTPEVVDGARLANATHVVYLADDLPLDARHRVRDADGAVYAIERLERAEQLGDLMRLFVRRTA